MYALLRLGRRDEHGRVPPAALPVFHCRLVHRLASVDSNISTRLCTKQTIATPGDTQAVLQGAVQQNALGEMAAVVELGAGRVPEVHAEGGFTTAECAR